VTTAPINRLVHSLSRTIAADDLAALSDPELLARFRQQRDPAAFEAIVRRHGPRVLAACRKVLPETADAEDAFQATFVILLRDSQAVRRAGALGPWLYGVAHRVALQARIARQRRDRIEAKAAARGADSPDLSWTEACAVLHEELDRLPDTHRLPLLLCYLEGLSRDEAAARLRRTLGSVKRSLEVGRDRLRKRLQLRGLALSAGLLAAVAEPAASAVPVRSVQAVVQAVGGTVSPAVATLARSAVGRSFPAAIASCLAASVVIACVALGQGYGQPVPPVKQPPGIPAAPALAKADEVVPNSVTYAGHVLDPDGKPVAGAKLFAVYYTPRVLPIPERGTSDKDGRFKFTIRTKEFDKSASARPWDEAVVYAVAPGFGFHLPDPATPWPDRSDLTLKLVKDDVPITGRIIDLQGKPVAGATVTVRQLWWPTAGRDLTPFVAALTEKRELVSTMIKQRFGQTGTWMGRDVGRILPPAVTDAEGKFRLVGVGRERVVALRIEGPTIAPAELWAMTRPGEPIRMAAQRAGTIQRPGISEPDTQLFAAQVEHVAAPGRAVAGTVRDKDTGKPIPGAVVESYRLAGANVAGLDHLRAVADRDGKYRLSGLPKGRGNLIRVRPPDGQPYLMAVADVPDAPGLEPVTADVSLKRGVWITGRVTEKDTGKPVAAKVWYASHGDNPNLGEAPGLAVDQDVTTGPDDGRFRLVGLPGRGVVAVRANGPGGYRTRVGADRIKGLPQFYLPIGGGGRGLIPAEFHAIAEVDPAKGAESVACDLVLLKGLSRTGMVVGPDGKPLAGALARGLDHPDLWDGRPGAGSEFTVRDLKPDEPRLVQFSHPEKNLAGALVIKADETGPLTVKLEPAATLIGRFVNPEGKPLADLDLIPITTEPLADPAQPSKANLTLGSFPRGLRTDKEGKFRITGLAPGLKYRVAVRRGMFVLEPEGATGVTVKAGETKDLGAVTIKGDGE
jgi:RNA polymerase sigma factor (sigma-70 family)